MAFERRGVPAVDALWPLEENVQVSRSYVLFWNITNRVIHVYWLDEMSTIRYHTTLLPGGRVKTNTFTCHSWVFCDRDSNELMCVRNVNRFWPMGYKILDPNNPLGMIFCRKEIKIHYPLRSLRESCLCRIVNILNPLNLTEATNAIEQGLSLPNVLINELKKRLRRPLGVEYLNETWAKALNVKYSKPHSEDSSPVESRFSMWQINF